MHKIICQVLIDRPKRLLIIGLLLLLLGFSWFAGGPIKEALAQSASTCQSVEILPEANKSAVDPSGSVRSVNVNALNVKLTCKKIVNVWKTLLSATDIVVALYLIAIAVATIFHIQYDTYSIKKTLPPLIVGVILANFSLFITRVMVDFASVLAVTFINAEGGQSQFLEKLIRGIFGNFGGTIGAYINSSAGDNPNQAFEVMFNIFKFLGGAAGFVFLIPLFFIGLIFTIVPAIFIFALALLFYARYYIVIALVVVSPLAFICLAFPPTQKYFQRWWQEAIKWIFMLPVSMFLLWLAIQMTKLVAGDNASIGSYLISLIFLYLAIKVPFGMGNIMGVDIGGKLGGLAKWAGVGAVAAGAIVPAWGVAKLRRSSFMAKKSAENLKSNLAKTQKRITQLKGEKDKETGHFTGGDIAEKVAHLADPEQARIREMARIKVESQNSDLVEQRKNLEQEAESLSGQRTDWATERLGEIDREKTAIETQLNQKINEEMPQIEQSMAGGIETMRQELSGLEKTESAQSKAVQSVERLDRAFKKLATAVALFYIPGVIDALKTRSKTSLETWQKEHKKETVIAKLAGPAAQLEAGMNRTRDAAQQMDEVEAAQAVVDNMVAKIDPDILQEDPEKAISLMRGVYSESPFNYQAFLNSIAKKEISTIEYGDLIEYIKRARYFMTSGIPGVREAFSDAFIKSLQDKANEDPEKFARLKNIADSYEQKGGLVATGALRGFQQGNFAAQAIHNSVTGLVEPVDEVEQIDKIGSITVGKANISEIVGPRILGNMRGIVTNAERELEAVLSLYGRRDQANEVKKAVQDEIKTNGLNTNIDRHLINNSRYLNYFTGLTTDGKKALQDLVSAGKSYYAAAGLMARRHYKEITSDESVLKTLASNLYSDIGYRPGPGGARRGR